MLKFVDVYIYEYIYIYILEITIRGKTFKNTKNWWSISDNDKYFALLKKRRVTLFYLKAAMCEQPIISETCADIYHAISR